MANPVLCEWTDGTLERVARIATASAANVSTATSEPVAHRLENMTTARLDRVRLTLEDAGTLTVVAKSLRPASAALHS